MLKLLFLLFTCVREEIDSSKPNHNCLRCDACRVRSPCWLVRTYFHFSSLRTSTGHRKLLKHPSKYTMYCLGQSRTEYSQFFRRYSSSFILVLVFVKLSESGANYSSVRSWSYTVPIVLEIKTHSLMCYIYANSV